MTSKNILLDVYITANQDDSYVRASLKKCVTSYNKNNKSNPLTMIDLFIRDYPHLLNVISAETKLDPSRVIENNFTKLLQNLSTLNTSRPENLIRKYLPIAYPPGTVLINRINNLKYTVDRIYHGCVMATCNDLPQIEVLLSTFLIFFKEV